MGNCTIIAKIWSSDPRRARSCRRCEDDEVMDDANTAQARQLLRTLHAQVDEISEKLEIAESRILCVHGRAASLTRRRIMTLRRELYEAHRLIDGLHRRFPSTRATGERRTS